MLVSYVTRHPTLVEVVIHGALGVSKLSRDLAGLRAGFSVVNRGGDLTAAPRWSCPHPLPLPRRGRFTHRGVVSRVAAGLAQRRRSRP
jgi:hypothetical protein